eukprot:gnl/MRDRNA2_/MRDRNA2_90051_c0_seq1.p1 gnl/MRDRNA2_/MRDRNA2_90051_c0~~gnl/MRDRNA2_/MRDRNA2_90051_c0_seq1.p1  ORF type:complete len:327 (+),score=78.50 gnl/MRDRNA2_/MRDRNA2_90051_c0_seq1:102-983(+)
MQSTLILTLLPAIALAVNPDRHVRVGHAGEPVQMAVQSDGAVLKVADPEPAPKTTRQTQDEQKDIVKKPQEVRDQKQEIKENIAKVQDITEEGSHGKKANIAVHSEDETKPKNVPKVEPKPKEEELDALAKETKVHQEKAPVKGGEVRAHQAGKARPKLPEGVSLSQDDPAATEDQSSTDQSSGGQSEESWKSAFFFFASLVLMAVLAIALIGLFYFRRDQAQKTDGPETVGLKSTATKGGSQYVNDSSSTSDSGEKIAMLFDRVRQSLEDLSDKTAQQADVAGGRAQGSNTI